MNVVDWYPFIIIVRFFKEICEQSSSNDIEFKADGSWHSFSIKRTSYTVLVFFQEGDISLYHTKLLAPLHVHVHVAISIMVSIYVCISSTQITYLTNTNLHAVCTSCLASLTALSSVIV